MVATSTVGGCEVGRILIGVLAASVACVAAPAFAGQCRDPWVTQAVTAVQGREPAGQGELGECNIKLYGGGQWSSYDDLMNKVRARYPRVAGASGPGFANGGTATNLNGNGFISTNGGNQGSSPFISTNGSNVNGNKFISTNGATATGR